MMSCFNQCIANILVTQPTTGREVGKYATVFEGIKRKIANVARA